MNVAVERDSRPSVLQTAQATVERENGGRPSVQVWGTRGMVVAMHPAAAQIGNDVLACGGNAFDAGVAVSAALAVLSPDWAGVAGDIAWLTYSHENDDFAHLDGYSTCPRAIDATRLARRFGIATDAPSRALREEPPGQRGIGAATSMVPGTPATWDTLSRTRCSMTLAALLRPAIELARRGFAVNRYLAESFHLSRDKVLAHAATREIYCSEGDRIPEEGDRLIQRELADTLSLIADRGVAEFYTGEIAQRIADCSRADGGAIGTDDLRAYRPVSRTPLRAAYRKHNVVTSGSPTAGLHLLQALTVIEGFDIGSLDYHSARSLHVLIEATKQALVDRRRRGGDPDQMPHSEEDGLGPDRIATMRAAIQPDESLAVAGLASVGGSTTHFVVRDASGNIVSATQSLGSRFGCGQVVEGTGLIMNDRTWWMSLREGPNVVAPGRRANIGHAPLVVCRDNRPIAALGSPGGFGIVQYLVQVLVNMLDYGFDVQTAIEAPRFRLEGEARRVWIEVRIDPTVRDELRLFGHEIVDHNQWTDML
jgi:gamma-glutamyltranspeptidase/glutathione hydrolase